MNNEQLYRYGKVVEKYILKAVRLRRLNNPEKVLMFPILCLRLKRVG